jgi:hypothetical protein
LTSIQGRSAAIRYDLLGPSCVEKYPSCRFVFLHRCNWFGWFVDSTPSRDEEFRDHDGEMIAEDSEALDRFDVMTAVMHELDPLLGLDHAVLDDLMVESLSVEARRLPHREAVDSATAQFC